MPEPEARAFAFATLVVGNLALILSNRSATRSLWTTLHIPNKTLWAVVGLAFVLLLSALYIPWAVSVLRFAPLPAHELAAACGLGLLSVLWFEGIKWARRSGPRAGRDRQRRDRPIERTPGSRRYSVVLRCGPYQSRSNSAAKTPMPTTS